MARYLYTSVRSGSREIQLPRILHRERENRRHCGSQLCAQLSSQVLNCVVEPRKLSKESALVQNSERSSFLLIVPYLERLLSDSTRQPRSPHSVKKWRFDSACFAFFRRYMHEMIRNYKTRTRRRYKKGWRHSKRRYSLVSGRKWSEVFAN